MARLYGCWEEVESGQEGTPDGPELTGWRFAKDRAVNWTLSGEIEVTRFPPCRVDLATNPWRLDFINSERLERSGKVHVSPGVFRFEGDKLVWVVGYLRPVNPETWPKELPGRPVDFTATKANDQLKRVMKRVDVGY